MKKAMVSAIYMSQGIKLSQVTKFHFFHVCDENADVPKVLMNQKSFVSGTTGPSAEEKGFKSHSIS